MTTLDSSLKTENIFCDLFSACSVVERLNYEGLVEGCDVVNTVTGSFLSSDADRGGVGSGSSPSTQCQL